MLKGNSTFESTKLRNKHNFSTQILFIQSSKNWTNLLSFIFHPNSTNLSLVFKINFPTSFHHNQFKLQQNDLHFQVCKIVQYFLQRRQLRLSKLVEILRILTIQHPLTLASHSVVSALNSVFPCSLRKLCIFDV